VKRALAIVTALLTMQCGARSFESRSSQQSSPTSAATTAPAETGSGTWSECYASFTPTGDARADLNRMTRACGKVGKMSAVTPVTHATQSEQDPVDRYTFYVPKAGACYRVYAVGNRGVADLDLLVRDPRGQDVVADLTHDAFPVLPPNGPLCFDAPGLYLLEVSVHQGQGGYAIQVWGNPDGVGNSAAN
jgi:hypothetical protein